MKTLLAVVLLAGLCAADLIPPGVRYIPQNAMIENLDTLGGKTSVVENWQNCYMGPCAVMAPDTIQAGSLFPVCGPGSGQRWQVLRIYGPTAADTQSITFTVDTSLVLNESPLQREEFHFRLYSDGQGKLGLGKVLKISTYNTGAKADTVSFALPGALIRRAVGETPAISLTCTLSGISYKLGRVAPADIQIVDVKGRLVKKMGFAAATEGQASLPKLAAGAYFVKLKTADGEVTQSLTISK